MIFGFLFENPDSAANVFNLLCQSLIIFLVGWLLLKTFKGFPAPSRSGLSLTIIIIVVLLPLCFLFYKSNNTFLQNLSLPSIQQTYNKYLYNKKFPPEKIRTSPTTVNNSSQKNSLSSEPANFKDEGIKDYLSANIGIKILNTLGLIWLLGSLFQLSRLFYSLSRYRTLKGKLNKIKDKKLDRILSDAQKAFHKDSLPSVYCSREINSPCSLGIIRPKIVIPHELFENSDDDELEIIVLHELSHIHHKDHAFGLLQKIVQILYWWNPLAYSINTHFSTAREIVCDNYVIRKKGAYPFANNLLSLAKKTSLVSRLPFSTGLANVHISLEKRIRNIVSKERPMDIKIKKSSRIFFAVFSLLIALIIGRQSWTLSLEQSPIKIIPLPDLIHPSSIAVDNNQLFIADEASISIYSLTDFSHQKKFGRYGQGPGEFQYPPRLNVFPKEFFFENGAKIMRYSRNGDFIGETKLPFSYFGLDYPLLPVGDNYVGFPGVINEQMKFAHVGKIYDNKFQMIKQFYEGIPLRIPPPPPPPKPGGSAGIAKKQDFEVIRDCINYAVFEDKIIVADSRKGFFISVFDSQGQLMYEINLDYKELKVPKQFKNAFMARLKERDNWENLQQRNNYRFRASFPAFIEFQLNKGKIYLTTNANKNNLYEIVVLDLKGEIIKRSFSLPSNLYLRALHDNTLASKEYVIFENRIYSLNYNDNSDYYELHIHVMD